MFSHTNFSNHLLAISTHLSKLSKITALSAVVLLTLTPSVQAAANNTHSTDNPKDLSTISFVDTFKYRVDSCDNSVQAPTLYSKTTKQQNVRRQHIACMLTQLRTYQQPHNHTSRQQYFAYKAQAWLNYAIHKDSIKSRSSASDHAFASATTILDALTAGTDQNLSLTMDIPSTSALMRPDLWAILMALKDSGGINEAPRELAFSEVALIWAAADYCKHGSRQSGGQFRMADRWLEQAREAYINVHDSRINVALEKQTVSYYKQFAQLDPIDNVCRGQILPLKKNSAEMDSNLP